MGLPYQLRKVISRIRCSNLAIEKGRHKNPKTPRQERLCTICNDQEVEDEEHFLLKCTAYSHLREHHDMDFENVPEILNMDNQHQLAKFLIASFELRQRLIWGRVCE